MLVEVFVSRTAWLLRTVADRLTQYGHSEVYVVHCDAHRRLDA